VVGGRGAEITILGSGPAAVATACGLRRIGHEVSLIGAPGNTAFEGVSERTLALLHQWGLAAAADSVGGPGERLGRWAGRKLAGNREYVVDRAQFDRALLIDAASRGVTIVSDRVIGYERDAGHWQVRTRHARFDCRLIVDARGRRVRRALRKGPDLIAVCQRFRTQQTAKVLTRIEAFPQGWCWLATNGRGMSWLQAVCLRSELSLRFGLERHLGCILAAAPQTSAALSQATPEGDPLARAATASLSEQQDAPGAFLAGDAMVALDPLSGQGMYEALRSATVAVAAAHSYRSAGDWDPIDRFLRERARDLWRRRSESAALFYAQQAEETPSAFWIRSAAAYAASQGADQSAATGEARIEFRPVLNGSLIELRRVVVTAQSPRGVWRIDAVDLAELVDFLRVAPTRDVERIAQQFSCSPAAVAHAMQWLSAQGLLGSAGSMAPQTVVA
jgi:flavin-dependent dehydrogenase